MNIDQMMQQLVAVIHEERASCIQDIEFAKLQGNSEEYKRGCEAAMEAIRTRTQRRDKARQFLAEDRPISSHVKIVPK